MRRLFVGIVMAATATIGFGSVAFAAGSGYNPPPQVSNVCDAGHGAFGAFSDPSLHFSEGQPPYFGDDVLGSARDGLTGLTNSSYSATCNL